MPIIEYILLGFICFGLGVSAGNKKKAVRQPTQQIILDDSTKIVNIYVDNYGQFWSDPRFTMRWDPYWRFGFYGPRVVVFHKGGKKYKKWVHPKRRKHLKKRYRG